MRIAIFFLLVVFWVNTVFAASPHRESVLEECGHLEDCFEALGARISENESGTRNGEGDAIRDGFKSRFGESARDAFLEKAISDHKGWRNMAGNVLEGWGNWREEHFLRLKEAFSKNPNGAMAHALGALGTAEAIAALLDQYEEIGGGGQTIVALKNLGPGVLPEVFARLERYANQEDVEGTPQKIRRLIGVVDSMGYRAVPFIDEWAATALNVSNGLEQRVSALWALDGVGDYFQEKSDILLPLLAETDGRIADVALTTLISARNPHIAKQYFQQCMNTYLEEEAYWPRERRCIAKIGRFGRNGNSAGALIAKYINGEDIETALVAIDVVGMIEYKEAIPALEQFLPHPDWRFVYHSLIALARLDARQSVPKIDALKWTYWLPEIGSLSSSISAALVQNRRFVNEPIMFDRMPGDCKSNVWYFEEKNFVPPKEFNGNHKLEFEGGVLSGSDRGEWGGELVWNPSHGEPEIIVEDNVRTMFQERDEAIVIFGLAHMGISRGYAALVSRDQSGQWVSKEIARFTEDASQVVEYGPGRYIAIAGGYGAHWPGRAILFTRDGIEKILQCDEAYGQ